jgi:hypothetical protein
VAEPIILRDQQTPKTLAVVRLGVRTLASDRLRDACTRCHERWGVWGFSVLEVPDGDDFDRLARLRPELTQRRQLLIADGHELAAAGFPLFPTLDYPHWTVVVAEPTEELFARVRIHFHGPVHNPAWAPSTPPLQ